ncbi:MAG: hypothetical protein MRY63_04865 [Neomegalonema sp.]|nr:hypothetical protein [Neomegalonema sp.]
MMLALGLLTGCASTLQTMGEVASDAAASADRFISENVGGGSGGGGADRGSTSGGGGSQKSLASASSTRDTVCRGERNAMHAINKKVQTPVHKAMLKGAIDGGLSALKSGNFNRGALIDSARRGAGNALVANLRSRMSAAQVTSKLSNDVAAQTKKAAQFEAAVKKLRNCRSNEAKAIRTAFQGGKLTKEEANAKMDGVRAKHKEDVKLANKALAGITANGKAHVEAYNDIAADNGYAALQYSESGSGGAVSEGGSAGGGDGSMVLAENEKSDLDGYKKACLANGQKRDDCAAEVAELESESSSFEV